MIKKVGGKKEKKDDKLILDGTSYRNIIVPW